MGGLIRPAVHPRLPLEDSDVAHNATVEARAAELAAKVQARATRKAERAWRAAKRAEAKAAKAAAKIAAAKAGPQPKRRKGKRIVRLPLPHHAEAPS